MNFLARFYPGDDAVRLAVSVALEIAGFVVLAMAASWIVARRNAAFRDGIWRAALALVCAAPLLASGFDRAGVNVWSRASRDAKNQHAPRVVFQTPTRHPQTVADQVDRRAESADPAESNTNANVAAQSNPIPIRAANDDGPNKPPPMKAVIGAITTIWAAIAVALLVRLVVGLRVVTRLRRDCRPFVDLPDGIAERLRKTLGVSQLPSIMICDRMGGPASVGLWRPVVVLPAELAANVNGEALHDMLAHECAHVLRHDALLALVEQIVAAVYWPHPLIYVLNRQLARAREEICDNVVLAGTTPTAYARTLLALSQAVQGTHGRLAVIPMFDRRWRLARRVAGILSTRRIVMTRMNRFAAGMVAAMAVTAGITLAAICAAADPPKETQTKAAATNGSGSNQSHSTTASNDGAPKTSTETEPKTISVPGAIDPAASGDLPVVPVSRVVERDVTDFEDFIGNIVAPESVKIIPRVTGYLVSTAFKEGAIVKKGDKLFEIDPRPFQAEVDRAEAELRVAETHLKFATAELDRYAQLRKSSGSVSQQDYDKAQATVQEAQAALTAAKANLETRRLTLSFCTIASPIDGRAGGFNVSPGNLVKQDETVLTTIVSHDAIGVSFQIDERTWLRLAKMPRDAAAKSLSTGGDMRVYVRADDEPDFEHEGSVSYIGNEFDRATGTIVARATIVNPTLKSGARLFLPGMHVTVRLMIGPPHKALLVRNEAINMSRGPIVAVLDDNDRIERRAIKLGQLQGDGLRVVTDGLGAGDRVALDAPSGVSFGDKIRPKLAPTPTVPSNDSKAEK